jgi:hypothetical protein
VKLVLSIAVLAGGPVFFLVPPGVSAAAMSTRDATSWAREAIRQEARSARQIRITCRVVTARARCSVRWRTGRRYSGTVTLVDRGAGVRYMLRAKSKASGRRARRLTRNGTVESTRVGASRERPVPRGATAQNENWLITVATTDPDATARVMAENQFNDPPGAGKQFYIARVRATYTGDESESFDGTFRLRSVGAAAVEYRTFDDSCGVIPDPITDAEVFPGGTIEGNVCWQIRSSDADSLVMFDDPFLAERRLFFALT